jgi:hypothetical protein
MFCSKDISLYGCGVDPVDVDYVHSSSVDGIYGVRGSEE